MLSLLALSIDRYQVLAGALDIFGQKKGGTPSVGMPQNNRSIQNMAGLKHAVDRFYQAEPELRQGKGELFLWEG